MVVIFSRHNINAEPRRWNSRCRGSFTNNQARAIATSINRDGEQRERSETRMAAINDIRERAIGTHAAGGASLTMHQRC